MVTVQIPGWIEKTDGKRKEEVKPGQGKQKSSQS